MRKTAPPLLLSTARLRADVATGYWEEEAGLCGLEAAQPLGSLVLAQPGRFQVLFALQE